MTVDQFLTKKVPNYSNVQHDMVWTLQILTHVVCVLGNDCLKKVPGAGKKEVINMVKIVVDYDGTLSRMNQFMQTSKRT